MSPRRKKERKLRRPEMRRLSGEELRAWRKKHDLTQAEAAYLIGVCQQTWSKWESEKRTPPLYLEFLLRCLEKEANL